MCAAHTADNRTVQEWHRIALARGFHDNGPPGEARRHNIEAVH
jgi:hypothetical protein